METWKRGNEKMGKSKMAKMTIPPSYTTTTCEYIRPLVLPHQTEWSQRTEQ